MCSRTGDGTAWAKVNSGRPKVKRRSRARAPRYQSTATSERRSATIGHEAKPSPDAQHMKLHLQMACLTCNLATKRLSSAAIPECFGDQSYFNRAFGRHFGATPSNVRASADEPCP